MFHSQAKLIDDVSSKKLIIALEPEAASLCCRNLDLHHFLGMESEKKKLNLEVNTKYIVIDAGGRHYKIIKIYFYKVLTNRLFGCMLASYTAQMSAVTGEQLDIFPVFQS